MACHPCCATFDGVRIQNKLHRTLKVSGQAFTSLTSTIRAELKTLLPKADIVVILVPLTPETHHLVNAEFLATMKQGAMLVNAGR